MACDKLNSENNSGWRVYLEPGAMRMAVFGFSSGLPLLLVIGTLGFWLREAGVDLATIGFFSWVGLIYGFKWIWAPLVDRMPIPVLSRTLGRRRAWLLAAQLMLACALLGLAVTDPQKDLFLFAGLAMLAAFASATQDIALDAYRIESAGERRQAAYAAMYQTGYRLGMIWAGAGALAIAAWAGHGASGYMHYAWTVSYGVMAASVLVGVGATLLSPEPLHNDSRDELSADNTQIPLRGRLNTALIGPFSDFFRRFGWAALLVLALIATYRISDVVMGVMANPFYQDLGFTKEEVAAVSKVFGASGCFCRRRRSHALRRSSGTSCRGCAIEPNQSAFFRSCRNRRESHFSCRYGICGQSRGRPGKCGFRSLSFWIDELEVFSDSICAFQLHHAAASKISGGIFRHGCGSIRI